MCANRRLVKISKEIILLNEKDILQVHVKGAKNKKRKNPTFRIMDFYT